LGKKKKRKKQKQKKQKKKKKEKTCGGWKKKNMRVKLQYFLREF
jgi:hypothetical protein